MLKTQLISFLHPGSANMICASTIWKNTKSWSSSTVCRKTTLNWKKNYLIWAKIKSNPKKIAQKLSLLLSTRNVSTFIAGCVTSKASQKMLCLTILAFENFSKFKPTSKISSMHISHQRLRSTKTRLLSFSSWLKSLKRPTKQTGASLISENNSRHCKNGIRTYL